MTTKISVISPSIKKMVISRQILVRQTNKIWKKDVIVALATALLALCVISFQTTTAASKETKKQSFNEIANNPINSKSYPLTTKNYLRSTKTTSTLLNALTAKGGPRRRPTQGHPVVRRKPLKPLGIETKTSTRRSNPTNYYNASTKTTVQRQFKSPVLPTLDFDSPNLEYDTTQVSRGSNGARKYPLERI